MSATLVERLRMGDGSSPDHALLLEAADALMSEEEAIAAREMQERTFDAAVDDLVELGKHWRRNRDRKILSHNIRRAIIGTCADLLSIDAEMSSPSTVPAKP